MPNIEIQRSIQPDERVFLKEMHQLQSEVSDLFLKIATGGDYYDESTMRLFSIHKFLKGS